MAAASNIKVSTISMPTGDGASAPALISMPPGPGPHPAIVFGGEAMGLNKHGEHVAQDAAAAGFVTITPDYYRGAGPSQPDNYEDFSEVMAAIADLDFGRAAHDLLAGADWLRAQPNVDPQRIVVWGYCTGGTLAMLASGADRRFAASVLFFPSQPVFDQLTDKRPVQPFELIWNMRGPVMVVYGDRDQLMPPERLSELKRRFEAAKVRNEIKIYPDAGHAFSAPAPRMYSESATKASWADAMDFLKRELGPR